MISGKGADARRRGRKEHARLFGGALDTAPVLRVLLKTLQNLSLLFVAQFFAAVLASAFNPQTETVPAGTAISVRTIDLIDSKTADLTHEYKASLADPIMVSGVTVAPLGTDATLRVEQAQNSGAASGRAVLQLKLASITVNNQRFSLQTAGLTSQSGAQGKKTGRDVGIGAAGGAAVGAASAGAIGAAVGASVGAAGGLITAATHKQHVRVPAETRLTFTLTQPASLPIGFASATPPQAPPQVAQVEAVPDRGPSQTAPVTQQASKQEEVQDGIRVQLLGCHRSASESVFCEIVVEALAKDMTLSLNIGFYNDTSFIVDDKGLQQRAAKVTLGSTSNSSSAATYVVQNVSVQGKLEFGAVDPSVDQLAILNLLIISQGHEYKFVYRHILLARK